MRPTPELPERLVLHGTALTRLSDDDFFELCQANPALRFERNTHQELIIMAPASSVSSKSGRECQGQLWLWNRKARLGHMYESPACFKLPDSSVRSPEVAWLSQAAWAGLTSEQQRRFPPVCPEFMMELKSPTDDLQTLRARMESYVANGMQLGFLLAEEAETAYVYRPGRPAETVRGFDQGLSGEAVLPGFQLDLRPLRRAL